VKFSLRPESALIQRFASCSHAYAEIYIEVIHVRAATPDLVGITIRDWLNRLRPGANHYQRE
jgi:hypothetical protein